LHLVDFKCASKFWRGTALKIIVISRITGALPFLACFLLTCAAAVYNPRPAFAQATGLFGELTQVAATDAGCGVRGFFHQTWNKTSQYGLKAVPQSVASLKDFHAMRASKMTTKDQNRRWLPLEVRPVPNFLRGQNGGVMPV
jgi:hypothetical protein